MSRSANKTLIGSFVLGAVALAVIAVLLFGSGRFFSKRDLFVMYFEGSVAGLNVGSPVMFRGVKIGTVRKISLHFRSTDLEFIIPVVAEFEEDKIITDKSFKEAEDYIPQMIRKGLRAQLQTQSFVTGQLMIALDFFPDTPANFVSDGRYDEIPTIPSTAELLAKKIQNMPIEEIAEKVRSIATGLDTLVNSETTRSSLRSLDSTLKGTARTIEIISKQMEPLLTEVRETITFVRAVSQKADQALSGEQGVPAQMTLTLEAARKALGRAEEALVTGRETMMDAHILSDEASASLKEISKAARSLRVLSESIEANPESLIWGQKPPEERKNE